MTRKTPAELIAKAETELKSRDGYRYSAATLEAILTAGTMEDGAVFMTTVKGHMVYKTDRVAHVVDGEEIATMPMSDEVFEAALIGYAKREAELAVRAR